MRRRGGIARHRPPDGSRGDERPIYVLVLRPEPGVDAIRALRAGLKIWGPDAAPRRLRRPLRLQRIGVGQRGVLGIRDRSLRQHEHFRPDLHAIVHVDHVLVCQLPADRGGRVRAMDAILRAGDIHRTRAERIAGAAGGHARQIRLARGDHGDRRGCLLGRQRAALVWGRNGRTDGGTSTFSVW